MGNTQIPQYNIQGKYKNRQDFFILSLNNTQQLLFAAKLTSIVIFGVFCFNRQFKIIQTLHVQHRITCLESMQKSTHFITAHLNNTIQIWETNSNSQWNIVKTLEGHLYPIKSLILSNIEELIITGSADQTIKFWNKKNDWECVQTVEMMQCVFGLCLNDSGIKLVCTGILNVSILNHSPQGYWQIVQTIKVKCGFYSIFINNDIFVYFPSQSNLEIYEFSASINEFKKIKKIGTPNSFQCCYGFKQKVLNKKQLIFAKKGEFVNLIKIAENNKFQILQSLEFGSYVIFGDICKNGSLFVVNDSMAGYISFFKQILYKN